MTTVFHLSKISWRRINIDQSVFAWMVLLSIGIHVVTGDRDAVVQVLSSGDGVLGHYTSLGSGDTVVTGILHEVTGNCTKKFVHPIVPDEEPIGILFLPEVDESKNHKEPSQSTTCTILDQVKQVMLLGCSALVVLALNPSILKDLDGSQMFSKPIVKVTKKQDVEFVKKEMKSPLSRKAVIKPVHWKRDEKPAVVSIPRLTLWSTCGKSSGGTHREWEGTVCLGGNQFTSPQRTFELLMSIPKTCPLEECSTHPQTSDERLTSGTVDGFQLKDLREETIRSKSADRTEESLHLEQDAPVMESSRSCILKGGVENDIPWHSVVCYGVGGDGDSVSFSTIWQYVFSLIVSVYVILTLKKTRRPRPLEDVEDSLQRLAKLSVSKMPTRKYKKKKQVSTQESDNCAICLEEFTKGQVIRMLPCRHHFHCRCVDDWLIKRRTCPLCKMDIVDQKFHCYSSL